MKGNSGQVYQIVASFVILLVLLLVLVSLDSWISGNEELVPQRSGAIEVDRANTEHVREAYQRWVFEHRIRAFSWHERSTKIIFWLSMFVAISGLGLSFWQFTTSVKEAEKATEENELTIKTELISLAFKSRSIAALILFLSVAYLAIYALFIYPLKEVATAQQLTPAVRGNQEASSPSQPSGLGLTEEILRAADNQSPAR